MERTCSDSVTNVTQMTSGYFQTFFLYKEEEEEEEQNQGSLESILIV